jgi:AraC-like DNA-binding protein
LNEPNGSWETTAILTREPQELLDHLNRHTRTALEKIDPIGRGGTFSFSRVEVDLGRVRLAQAHSTSVHMQGQASSLMTLIVSEQGQSVLKRKAGGEVVSSKGDAAIIAAKCDMIFQSSPGDVRYIVQLPHEHIVELLQESEHRRVKELGPLLRLEFSTPVATSFHRAVNFIWRQQVVPTRQLRAAYDEILLHGLARLLAPLLLDRPDRPPDPGPAHIHRACELIRAKAMEPIRVAEIARELGITPRCLQSGFRKHLGTTPHQFLRDCRLDLAHHMLTASLAGQTTTSIAYDCGFGHLGEFAHAYRSRFGESPSQTLRRSRNGQLVSS